MSSAAETELGALYITSKEMLPIRQTLIEMGWKQPLYPIQTDKSSYAGVAKKTTIQRKSKYMDLSIN